MATDMKEKFEIKNYVKLICLRLDHYESFIEDEVNTDCISDINNFILKHKNEEGVKILIFEMKNMRIRRENIYNIYMHSITSVG